MRAIVIKELRENLRWLPIGILLVGVFVWQATPTELSDLRGTNKDVSQSLMLDVGVGAAILAMVLAALQSVFDFSDQQRGYLFHRSVSTNAVLYGKVVAGAILYTIACAVPLVCVALWFAWQGLEFLPVRPAQVLPAVGMCVACFFLHPATLISVERSALWFGTKLLPLLVVAGALFLIQAFELTSRSPWRWTVITCYVLFFISVLFAVQPAHWTRKWLVVIGAFVTTVSGVLLAITLVESMRSSPLQFNYAIKRVDAVGDLWYLRVKREYDTEKHSWLTIPISGERIQANQKPDLDGTLPDNFEMQEITHFQMFNPEQRADSEVSIKYVDDLLGKAWYFDSRGMVLVYDWSLPPRLSSVISRNGLHSVSQASGAGFSLNPIRFGKQLSHALNSSSYESLWADSLGVYQLDQESGAITTLIDMPIEAGMSIQSASKTAPQLLLQSEGKYHLFSMLDKNGNEDWYHPLPNLYARFTNASLRPLPPLKLQPTATIPALPSEVAAVPTIRITPQGKLLAVAIAKHAYATFDLDSDRQWQVTEFISPERAPFGIRDVLITSIIPVGTLCLGFGIFTISNLLVCQAVLGNFVPPNTELLPLYIALTVMVALAVAIATYVFCRRRELGLRACGLWMLASLFLGLSTPLAIVAVYPKLVRQPCPGCQRLRRVDRLKCSHCGTVWSPPPRAGIELIEGQALVAHSHPHPA